MIFKGGVMHYKYENLFEPIPGDLKNIRLTIPEELFL